MPPVTSAAAASASSPTVGPGARSFSIALWSIGTQTVTVKDTTDPALTDAGSVAVRLL